MGQVPHSPPLPRHSDSPHHHGPLLSRLSGLQVKYDDWEIGVLTGPHQLLCSRAFISQPKHFRIEHQANLLWIPADSDYNTREDWLDINFKSKSRDEIILFSNENVLTPESMKEVRDTEIKF